MKREEFIGAIGYQGDSAIIDKKLMEEAKSADTRQLLEKGQYRAAFCSALYNEKNGGVTGETDAVLAEYNKNAGRKIESVENLKRLFGVFDVPADIVKRTLI